ncbi:tetratricopeptide repeat-containing diguanylate cyclase [Vibrio rotiferianus]|uniref:tetratricopeptide repeat-containing diguanylate cyclase n=1 Tax=Vibrio rotiferianus TaxID=190895 RepID=UPI0015F56278|nr:diguanylate cyclase [Vibrio rotiferianus]
MQNTAAEDLPTLQFYFESIGKPRAIKNTALEQPNLTSPQAQALYYFARIYLERYEGVPISDLPDMVAFGNKHQLQWVIAEAKLNKAIEYIEADDVWQGELLLHDVINISREIGYKALQGRAYRWLGNAEIRRSQVQAGMRHYRTAFDLLDDSHFEIQVAMTLNNIASVYIETSDWTRAENYINQAIKTYLDKTNSFDNSLFLGILYANKSVIEFAQERYTESEYYFEQAVNLSMETGSDSLKHTSLANLSQLLSAMGKTTDALALAQRCLALPTINSNSGVKVSCYEAFSEAYLIRNEFNLAIDNANKALEQMEITLVSESRERMDMLLVLVQASQELKQYEQAFHYLSKLRSLEKDYDSHADGEEMLDIKFDLEAKLAQKELKLLEAQNDLQASKLQAQRYREIFYFLSLIGIASLGIRYVSRIKRVNRELAEQNVIDPLTQVHNRRYLPHWLRNMANTAPESMFSLAVIDIDYFKQFNDTYGHDKGDQMLKHVSSVIKRSVRSKDLLARWGGEEFVLVFETKNIDECSKTLERLRKAVENEKLSINSLTLSATISIGAIKTMNVTMLNTNWDDCFMAADQALYEAKQAGRNQYKINSG